MPEIKLESKSKEDALMDIVQSTALEKAALAELFNASAEEMRNVMKLEDITVDKLINFQGSLDTIIKNGVEVQKLLQSDMNSLFQQGQSLAALEEEVFEVEEEISEEIIDGKKRIKKTITKKNK
ncbi:hypothetical protein [Orenia marismortui]|uniref:Uncharacterized protein n=1 Tax=Orenia marismortui TaxID=46469 RepID=A0A4R8GWV1_9FIRM|nr:hypothetical protein [Orenia marismortui]TDX46447.1 hypothetical protein C7959_1416 [Orenia marismortui]